MKRTLYAFGILALLGMALGAQGCGSSDPAGGKSVSVTVKASKI